jgi:regulator of sirC expression with transglutaminase-like and TPR domain
MPRPAETPRDRFAAIASANEPDIALDEAALWIAAEEYAGLDVSAYLARLDALAEGAGARLEGARSDVERVGRLNRFLFLEEGFSGNHSDYYDPRNSYLNEVLDRRSGIPITLSLVYIAVGRRLGLRVEGIGFPGHFLVKWSGEQEIIIDAFLGETLSLEDCQKRLDSAAGQPVALRPELHLRAAGAHEILTRMLGNLKQIFVQRQDWNRALDCCERTLIMFPDAPHELRDRGLVLEQIDCFHAAAADLDRFLELAPNDPSAPGVRARRQALEQRLGQLH